MYDVIDLLDTLGRRPAETYGPESVGALSQALPVDQVAALRAGDTGALARALGARATMFCMIVAPDEGELPPEGERPERDEPDPDREDRDARQD